MAAISFQRSSGLAADGGTVSRLGDSQFAEPRVYPWQPTGDAAAYIALTTAQAAARQFVAEATWTDLDMSAIKLSAFSSQRSRGLAAAGEFRV